MIEPEAELEAGVAGLDVVLDVRRLLLDRRRLRVLERRPAARQIVRSQARIVVRAWAFSANSAEVNLYP